MTILVVDDEPDILELVCSLLRAGTAHTVLAAADPQAALALFEQQTVDLLVTDFQLPGMDGVELAEVLKPRHPKLKVLLISAFADSGIGAQALERGTIHAVAHKSADPASLLQQVERLLR